LAECIDNINTRINARTEKDREMGLNPIPNENNAVYSGNIERQRIPNKSIPIRCLTFKRFSDFWAIKTLSRFPIFKM
jgi:hypothetical protein